MRLWLRRTMTLRLAVWCLVVLLFSVALYLRPLLFSKENNSPFGALILRPCSPSSPSSASPSPP